MLLSEMFGVERDTDFGVEGYSVTFKIATFSSCLLVCFKT